GSTACFSADSKPFLTISPHALAGSARGVRPDCAPGQSGSDTRSRFAPAVHLELLQDIVDVILDGGHLDPQPLGDLLVRDALVDEPHDLALALGEMRWDSSGAASAREGGDPAQQRALSGGGVYGLSPHGALAAGKQ